ncbi:MAG: hypothetical protein ACRD8Z_28285 [Nitrososphaeraceae archaeon]
MRRRLREPANIKPSPGILDIATGVGELFITTAIPVCNSDQILSILLKRKLIKETLPLRKGVRLMFIVVLFSP